MNNNKSEVLIENENLFRALVCAPFGIAFTYFAINAFMNSGLVLFKIIFVLMALYFALNSLAHAAYYTNELYDKKSDTTIKNENLFKTFFYAPLAVMTVWVAVSSVISSNPVFFSVLAILLASYFVLKTLAHAAYYTNEYHAKRAHH